MVKIMVEFKRVARVFDEAVRALRPCESSGSEHSPESPVDNLSDLIDSFIEKDYNYGVYEVGRGKEVDHQENEDEPSEDEPKGYCFDSDMNKLKSLLYGDDAVKLNIRVAAEKSLTIIGNSSSEQGFKRLLMTMLRERGFDAGLCKSKWEKSGRIPSGTYEYIDVNVAGTRYIVEVLLHGEFQIARPTNDYSSLLNVLPQIFVGKVENLKPIVRLMGNAIRLSLKSSDLDVPPWRKYRYMQAKWFGSYKRTTNESPAQKIPDSDEDTTKKRRVGFAPLAPVSYYCREEFGSKDGMKVGLLTMAFKDTTMFL